MTAKGFQMRQKEQKKARSRPKGHSDSFHERSEDRAGPLHLFQPILETNSIFAWASWWRVGTQKGHLRGDEGPRGTRANVLLGTTRRAHLIASVTLALRILKSKL